MSDIPTVLRVVCAFTVVGLALYGFAVISRGRSAAKLGARADRLVSVIETTPLSQTAALHVVKLGERYHVIALSSGTVSLLAEIEPPIVERFAAARKPPTLLGMNARLKNDRRQRLRPENA